MKFKNYLNDLIEKVGKKHLVTFYLPTMAIFLLAIIGTNIYSEMKKELKEIKSTQHADHVETRQFLLSTVSWSSERQRITLFMRDQIIKEWARIGKKSAYETAYEMAYMIAEKNMKEAEKFPTLDPLFLLSLQWKESSFRDSVESPMGAIGLCQIMPSTARLLTGFYQMEYSRESLYNIETNIKLSAKLLDILYQEYKDHEVVLAGYNGGPWQAYYYQKDKTRLASETSDYVPKVMGKWKEYQDLLKGYKVESTLVEQPLR